MASAAVQSAPNEPSFTSPSQSGPTIAAKPPQYPENEYKPRDIVADMYYYLPPADGGPPPDLVVKEPDTYFRPKQLEEVTVHDMRSKPEGTFTLDNAGFQVVPFESEEKEFLDDDKIKEVYYKEAEEFLKKVTGASQVVVFDHLIRRNQFDSTNRQAEGIPPTERMKLRGPVQSVHVDQSFSAGPIRVRRQFPDEEVANRLLQGRYQIINLWRPIKPIKKGPLAVCDWRSLDPEKDLVPMKLVFPDRVGETFTVHRGEGRHSWWYYGGMAPGDALLIKCFDSKTDGRARCSPHSSFVDPLYEDGEARESIEIRILVLHEDDRD